MEIRKETIPVLCPSGDEDDAIAVSNELKVVGG